MFRPLFLLVLCFSLSNSAWSYWFDETSASIQPSPEPVPSAEIYAEPSATPPIPSPELINYEVPPSVSPSASPQSCLRGRCFAQCHDVGPWNPAVNWIESTEQLRLNETCANLTYYTYSDFLGKVKFNYEDEVTNDGTPRDFLRTQECQAANPEVTEPIIYVSGCGIAVGTCDASGFHYGSACPEPTPPLPPPGGDRPESLPSGAPNMIGD